MSTRNTLSPERRSVVKTAILMVVLLLLGVAVVLALGLVLRGRDATVQTVERSFAINEDFTRVRKILVRTDAVKQIVTMTGDSEFIEQNWSTVGAGLEAIELSDLKWIIELHGTLKVRTRDPYIGAHVIELSQAVKIDPDEVYSDVKLARPSERLLQYGMTTRFTRKSDGTTLVRQRLMQEIVTDAPWFAHLIADRRVRQSAEQALLNQQQAILQIIEKHRGRRWLLLNGAAGN